MKKEKQKVLILVTLAEVGGAQMSVLNLSREFIKRGYDVKVGFGEGEFLSNECKKWGIPTKRFKNLKRSFSVFENIKFIFELKDFLKKEKFDVLHINSSNALLGALSSFLLFRDRPYVVFTYRGMSFLDKRHETSTIKRIFYRLIFRFFVLFVDKEVFVSKENFQSAKDIGLGKKGIVVYNGLPLTEVLFLERDLAREEIEKVSGRVFKDKIIVGSIGRLAYQKNYEFLIKNWKSIKENFPEAVCLVIGDGPDYDHLKKMIKEGDIEDSFFLIGEYSNAGRLLKGFDVFVLTSHYEGLSITTLEALFSGVPILISKTGGNPEVISNFEPFLFEVNKGDEFKDKLSNILSDKENWKRKAYDISRKESYRFSISQTVNGYEYIYKNGKTAIISSKKSID